MAPATYPPMKIRTFKLTSTTLVALSFTTAAIGTLAQSLPKPAVGVTIAQSADFEGLWFRQLDANNDGRISREEARESRFLSKHFDEIDTKHDGYISPDENLASWDQLHLALAKKSTLQFDK